MTDRYSCVRVHSRFRPNFAKPTKINQNQPKSTKINHNQPKSTITSQNQPNHCKTRQIIAKPTKPFFAQFRQFCNSCNVSRQNWYFWYPNKKTSENRPPQMWPIYCHMKLQVRFRKLGNIFWATLLFLMFFPCILPCKLTLRFSQERVLKQKS